YRCHSAWYSWFYQRPLVLGPCRYPGSCSNCIFPSLPYCKSSKPEVRIKFSFLFYLLYEGQGNALSLFYWANSYGHSFFLFARIKNIMIPSAIIPTAPAMYQRSFAFWTGSESGRKIGLKKINIQPAIDNKTGIG